MPKMCLRENETAGAEGAFHIFGCPLLILLLILISISSPTWLRIRSKIKIKKENPPRRGILGEISLSIATGYGTMRPQAFIIL